MIQTLQHRHLHKRQRKKLLNNNLNKKFNKKEKNIKGKAFDILFFMQYCHCNQVFTILYMVVYDILRNVNLNFRNILLG